MFYKKYKNASIINMENSNESLSQVRILIFLGQLLILFLSYFQIFVNEYYTLIEKSPDLSESEIFAKVERQMKDSGIDL
uniref:FtsH_ext domain-containing protein n=1 Tax=Heterorhabditis bacteriophora TaxID=37862 RepID=A0A1I7XL39_HETBA